MLLSGTDNRRNHSEGYSVNSRTNPHEVEALQSRAREYTRQQVEQMDDWERALHREWVSLFQGVPYPFHIRWKEHWRMERQHPNRSKLLQPSRIGILPIQEDSGDEPIRV